ncbi:Cof-type HAD-IIB family hydrolase [Companilactobacillus halodurans]|uniref:HAD family hydrolase n=1 Tax=Companilactobacillus halodurans TaxID=2584183 RepID=A0A5P0ZWX7_9LACO|nr:Cof-type HAD-IIB family hydrolase [Companilactobacillus halodurans]MQS75328.1 HAD family hydrolase [Companilactobacillus halodurans]MQS97405.1 HAD family hydrolase [Companilactobacillus halodurans]
MNNIKIIFFDIDGTLIDMNKKQISEKTLETLKRLKKQNIIICIATGRSPIALPHFENLTFDTFLTFNGSYCFNQTESIYKNPIPTKDVEQIVNNGKELGRPVAIATSDSIITNGTDDDLVEYFSFANQEVVVSKDFNQTIENTDIFQLMMGARKKDYEKIIQNTTASKITAWWDRAIDIIPTSSGKGTGIAEILKYYGLDKSQAMAFGDGNNDIEMLNAVGHGLAMGNASAEVKEIADEVIGDVTEDGIYHYCLDNDLI